MEARSTRRLRRVIRLTAVVGVTALAVAACGPENKQNSLRPKGPSAIKIDDLFRWPLAISIVVGIAVLTAVVVVAIKFRSKDGQENVKQVHGNTTLEITWTIIPAVILVILAIPTALLIKDLAQVESNALPVTAVGKQWWWEFVYPSPDTKPQVVTSTELHIPIGRQVVVNATACDYDAKGKIVDGTCNVIHSFWVPELAGKADAVPGREHLVTIQADEPGTYLGQCAEYCGLSHANMRFRVIAQTQADYDAWLANQHKGPVTPVVTADGKAAGGKGSPQDLIVNKFQCVNCHTFESTETTNYGPNLTHFASRSTMAGGTEKVNQTDVQNWVHDAPGIIPMESEGCRFPPPATCVGMPNFSRHVVYKGVDYPGMTKAEAATIAEFLLTLK